MKNRLFALTATLFFVYFAYSQVIPVTIQPGPSNGKDALVIDVNPSSNYGSLAFFRVNKTSTYIDRTFIEMDVSSIPSNAIIIEAKLMLYRYSGFSVSTTMEVNKVIDSWQENTITWGNAPNVTSVDMKSVSLSTSNNIFHEIDVTSHIQEFVNYPHLNNGWRLKCQNETTNNGSNYRSSNFTTTPAHRPKLEISYVLPIDITLSSVTHASDLSSSNGSVTASVSGGDGSYTYQWIDGATGNNISGATGITLNNVSPGWYGLEVEDGEGVKGYMAFVVGAECGELEFDFQPDERFIDDTYVFDFWEDNNYSQNTGLGAARINFFSWLTAETYIKFNIILPNDLNLNKADLTLKGSGNHIFNNGNAASFSQVTENWSESTLTWAIKPSSGTVLHSLPSTTTVDEDLELDLSDYFFDVQQGDIDNYGFRYHLTTLGSVNRQRQYHSSNVTTASNRPKMSFSIGGCPYQILVKSDNTGTSSNNQFEFRNALGEYDVIAKNTSTNNVEVFKGLVNQQTITFDEGAGTYELKVYPVGTTPFHRIMFANGGDKSKLLEIQQWGDVEWSTMQSAYMGCNNLDVKATDAPDLSNVTLLNSCFRLCNSLIGNSSFNNWDVSNVLSFSWMFAQSNNFNQNIGNWNVSSGTNFGYMFYINNTFNNGGSNSINNWNISTPSPANINMIGMFRNAPAFNQPLNNWNTSGVTNMTQMFMQASSFNQNIGSWNVSNVTNMNNMFRQATNFNNGGNASINNWNTQSLTNTSYMFYLANSFNQNIGNWNMSNILNLTYMFYDAAAFNNGGSPAINNWNVSNISSFIGLFRGASSFNQDLSGWNVGSATSMWSMFLNATSFSHSLGNWDVSNVTQMFNILDNTALSTAAYDATLIGWNNLPTTQTGVNVGANGLTYCGGDFARANLISSQSWAFAGDSYTSSCYNRYVELKRNLDGGYYKSEDGNVYFIYREEYEDTDKYLDYVVYDDLGEVEMTSENPSDPKIRIERGLNKHALDVGALSEGFYTLEVTNEKNETLKLRFKVTSTTM